MSAEKLRKAVEAAGWEQVGVNATPAWIPIEVHGRDSTGDWQIVVYGDEHGQPTGHTAVHEPDTQYEQWYEPHRSSTVPTPEQLAGRIEQERVKAGPQ